MTMVTRFLLLTVVVLLLLTIPGIFRECESRAHHKVHNLALFPDRHSWCQITPIKQEINSHDPECLPTTIDNVVCLGACFSYSVPRAEDDAVIEPYCDACRPTVTEWTVISLNCTRSSNNEHYFLPKNVELISNCSCVDCNDNTQRVEEESDEEEEDDEVDLSNEAAAFKRITINSNAINAREEEEEDNDGSNQLEGIQHLKSVSAEVIIQDNKITEDDEDTVHKHGRMREM